MGILGFGLDFVCDCLLIVDICVCDFVLVFVVLGDIRDDDFGFDCGFVGTGCVGVGLLLGCWFYLFT